MRLLKCYSAGILLVLLCCCIFAKEVGYSKEEMSLGKEANVLSFCWKTAYESLVMECSEMLVDEEKTTKIAWNLTDCVQKDDGTQPFADCDVISPMKDCLKKLDDDAHVMYLEFYRKTNDICRLLQTGAAFKRQMERLAKELRRGTMQQEEMIVEVDSKQQELVELEEQLNKVQEKLELIQESLPLAAEKLYTFYTTSLKNLGVVPVFVIYSLITLFIYKFCP